LNLRGNNLQADLGDDRSVAAFRSMRSLRNVDLGENQLAGTIQPTALFATPRDVTVLLLDANQLSGAGFQNGNFANFTNLRRCRVDQNRFNGTLFSSWDEFPRLTELSVNDNQFTGALPTDIPAHLVAFVASNNALTGPLPESLISSSPTLEYLDLANNRLDGPLPHLFPPQLIHFDVHANALDGTISSSIIMGPPMERQQQTSSLEYFDITANNIRGSLAPLCDGIILSEALSVRADCLNIDEVVMIDCPCCTMCCHSVTGQCVDQETGWW
jgi:Leucine Rich repeat